jgi:predicted O-methyltransferase YrrM
MANPYLREVSLDASLNPRLPEIGIADLCPDGIPVKIYHPEFESGGVYPLELICLCSIAAAFRPLTIFEIGTFNGRTALNLAANSPAAARLLTLDLPEQFSGETLLTVHDRDPKYIALRKVGSRYRNSRYRKKITQLFGDSASFDYAPYTGTIDLVLVDGAHSYDYVLNDSLKTLPLLSPDRGIMLWHDYGTWDEVTKAIDDLYEHNPDFAGVRHIRGTSLVIRPRM